MNHLECGNFSGIYKLSINNDCYIGSTVNLTSRLYHHIKDLKSNRHHSRCMQRSFNKYGEEELKIEILKVLPEDVKLLREVELYFIEVYKPKFNSTTPITYIHSEEMKQKISETLKIRYKEGMIKVFDHPKRKIPVKVYNFKDELIGEFSSTKEAIRKVPELSNATSLKNNIRRNVYYYKNCIVIPNNENFNTYIEKGLKEGQPIPIIKITKEGSSIIDKKSLSKSFFYVINKNKGKITKVRGTEDALFIHLGYYSKLIDEAMEILNSDINFPYKTVVF